MKKYDIKNSNVKKTGAEYENGMNREKECGRQKEESSGSRKQECAYRIMEALSGVDEELLERSGAGIEHTRNRKKTLPFWRTGRAWAAVLCLAVVGALGWGGYRWMDSTGYDGSFGGSAAFLNESTKMEIQEESYREAGAAAGDTDGEAAPESGQELETEEDRGSEEDGLQNMQKAPGAESGEDMSKAGVEIDSCQSLNAVNYTMEEVLELDEFKAYIPSALPEGYLFESAYSDLDREEQNLTVCWSRGMDLIMVSLCRTEGRIATVDVQETETYDVRLYEIPFGESVPDEYRQTFNSPVFAREDLDLEIVKSRMMVVNDSGDTDTPRGNFNVLYSDGMLLCFNGRGRAEEIWTMFCSMEN